ncbi:MAG: BrnT family toxin [Pseudomonadota bacterium]|nr:BrnT family toxin [Pseudomonadota bacterium]
MEIEFDEAKDASNLRKHGVSLALAGALLANPIGEVIDDRYDYGETRLNTFGLVEGRLFVCTSALRERTRRIISVRKANRREQRAWLS